MCLLCPLAQRHTNRHIETHRDTETQNGDTKRGHRDTKLGHRDTKRAHSIGRKATNGLCLLCRKNVSICVRLYPFSSVCVRLCPFVSVCIRLCPSVSVCVLATDTSLNVSFSISIVAKYHIQNRDFSKCQFVPKMMKTSKKSLFNEWPPLGLFLYRRNVFQVEPALEQVNRSETYNRSRFWTRHSCKASQPERSQECNI